MRVSTIPTLSIWVHYDSIRSLFVVLYTEHTNLQIEYLLPPPVSPLLPAIGMYLLRLFNNLGQVRYVCPISYFMQLEASNLRKTH